MDVAELIWRRAHGGDRPLRVVHDPRFEHDVPMGNPHVGKARRLLGFETTTGVQDMLSEVIPWIGSELVTGRL
jgi:UDP-glucose 4-epimerase